jgi:hypothetical protein
MWEDIIISNLMMQGNWTTAIRKQQQPMVQPGIMVITSKLMQAALSSSCLVGH